MAGCRRPCLVGQRRDRLPDALPAVVAAYVERIGEQLEHGFPSTRDVVRLLPQQLADLGIRHAAPERQVEQRPIARVEIADGGGQAVGRHS